MRYPAVMDYPLRCRCGTLRGHVRHPDKASRVFCYCRDCQAYAHHLGRAGDVLDALGGTEIVATQPACVTLTQGTERLACLSLTEQGLMRWYASCCNTPIGNTPRDRKTAYVGLVHSCLEGAATSVADAFGPIRMRVNRKAAKGRVPPMPTGSNLLAVGGLMKSLVGALVTGGYRKTPFFDAESGRPVVTPEVLSAAERDRAMQAVDAPLRG